MYMYNMNFSFLLMHQIIKEKLSVWLVLCHENVQGAWQERYSYPGCKMEASGST